MLRLFVMLMSKGKIMQIPLLMLPFGQRLLKQGKNIKIELDDSTHDYIQVCLYDESS